MDIQPKQFFNSFCRTLAVAVCGEFVYLGLTGYITHQVSASVFGDYSVITSVVFLLAPLITLGSGLSASRFIPHYLSNSQEPTAHGFLTFTSKMVFLLAAAVAIFAFVLRYYLKKYDLDHPLFSSGCLVVTTALLLYSSGLIESMNRPAFSSAMSTTLLDGFQWLILFVMINIFALQGDLTTTIGSFLIAELAILLMGYYLIRFKGPKTVWGTLPDFNDKRLWISFGLIMVLQGIFASFLERIDLIILQMVHKNKDEVGVFSVCCMVADFLWIAWSAIIPILRPIVNEMLEEKHGPQLQRIYNLMFFFNAVLTGLIAFIFVIWHRQALSFFGSTYLIRGVPTLMILLVGGFIDVVLSFPIVTANFAGYERKTMYASILVLIYSVVAMPFAVIYFGIVGAAFVRVSALLLLYIYGFYLMKFKLNMRPLCII